MVKENSVVYLDEGGVVVVETRAPDVQDAPLVLLRVVAHHGCQWLHLCPIRKSCFVCCIVHHPDLKPKCRRWRQITEPIVRDLRVGCVVGAVLPKHVSDEGFVKVVAVGPRRVQTNLVALQGSVVPRALFNYGRVVES